MPGHADIDPESSRPARALGLVSPLRVARLDNLRRVRAELGRLYREARRREGRFPDALTAQRLSNVLGALRTAIEVDELHARVAELEARLGERT